MIITITLFCFGKKARKFSYASLDKNSAMNSISSIKHNNRRPTAYESVFKVHEYTNATT